MWNLGLFFCVFASSCVLCQEKSLVAQEHGVPKFVYASDFYQNVNRLAEVLDLSENQMLKFQSLRDSYNENLRKLSSVNLVDLEPELRALSRSERFRVMRERMNEQMAQDYFDVLATDGQRAAATQYILQFNMHPINFSEFLRRTYVRRTLKLSEEMLIQFDSKCRESTTSLIEPAQQIAEFDQQLRMEVLAVLSENDRNKFTPYLPETEIGRGPRKSNEYLTEAATWMNLQAVLQSRTIDIDQLLELSDSQKKELMSLPRKYNDKIKKEIELTSKEKIADADPLRMEEFAKDVFEIADSKIGKEAGAEICKILVPTQVSTFAHLVIRQQLVGESFFYSVTRPSILKTLDVDVAKEVDLRLAAEKALKKRAELIRKKNSDAQLEFLVHLPQEQQELFSEHFGKYLK